MAPPIAQGGNGYQRVWDGEGFFRDYAVKVSKKLDPLKISILQPLRDANFLGPSRLQD
jgi:hypothetical protein